MTPEFAVETLEEWTALLRATAAVELHCDMPLDEIVNRLALRQQSIDRIQQLDGSLTELRRLKDEEWHDIDLSTINNLMAQGRDMIEAIHRSNAELVDIAMKNRSEILESLRRSSLSKGYFSANTALKIRPPILLDDNA